MHICKYEQTLIFSAQPSKCQVSAVAWAPFNLKPTAGQHFQEANVYLMGQCYSVYALKVNFVSP